MTAEKRPERAEKQRTDLRDYPYREHVRKLVDTWPTLSELPVERQERIIHLFSPM